MDPELIGWVAFLTLMIIVFVYLAYQYSIKKEGMDTSIEGSEGAVKLSSGSNMKTGDRFIQKFDKLVSVTVTPYGVGTVKYFVAIFNSDGNIRRSTGYYENLEKTPEILGHTFHIWAGEVIYIEANKIDEKSRLDVTVAVMKQAING